jgi:RNA polymerase sigma-B factor
MSVRLDRVTENDLVIIAKTNHAGLDASSARERLLKEHKTAIRAVAARLCAVLGRGDLLDELAQEGLIAFNQAIDKFLSYSELNSDTGRDGTARLWTYAFPGVSGAMWDHLNQQRHGGIVGLGRRMRLARKALCAHDDLMGRSQGKKPTPEEIASELNLSLKDVKEALTLAETVVIPINPASTSDESEEPAPQLRAIGPLPSEQAEWRERLQDLCQAIGHLRDPRYGGKYERKLKVFILRHFAEMDVSDIAEEHGMKRETVSSDLRRVRFKLQALLTHLSDELLARYHAEGVTKEEREHVETHLSELSPDEPYCQPCKSRSDRLKLIVPLYLRNLDVNQIVTQLNFPAELVKNAVAAMRRALPRSNDEELNRSVSSHDSPEMMAWEPVVARKE